jgi:hypothetical protein
MAAGVMALEQISRPISLTALVAAHFAGQVVLSACSSLDIGAYLSEAVGRLVPLVDASKVLYVLSE